MVKGKARAVGSFFGGIANNPGIVILGIALGGLFIFRDKISNAFASLGEGFGNIDVTLPEIKLPDITFPEFNFPDFSGIFQGFQDQLSSIAGQTVTGSQGQDVTIPPDTMVDPDTGIVTSETPPTIVSTTGKGMDITTLFGELRPKVFDTLINLGFEPAEAFGFLKNVTTIEGLNQVLQSVNSFGQINQQDIEDIPGVAPTNLLNQEGLISDQKIKSFLINEQQQQFGGGGVSFVGGSIFETPIENLSLSQIIDKFGVTASQASNIKAIAGDDFGDFDFGTNTGLGIGSVIPGLPGIQESNVSDPQFQGLTPQQIFLQLVGGNIQNF